MQKPEMDNKNKKNKSKKNLWENIKCPNVKIKYQKSK